MHNAKASFADRRWGPRDVVSSVDVGVVHPAWVVMPMSEAANFSFTNGTLGPPMELVRVGNVRKVVLKPPGHFLYSS